MRMSASTTSTAAASSSRRKASTPLAAMPTIAFGWRAATSPSRSRRRVRAGASSSTTSTRSASAGRGCGFVHAVLRLPGQADPYAVAPARLVDFQPAPRGRGTASGARGCCPAPCGCRHDARPRSRHRVVHLDAQLLAMAGDADDHLARLGGGFDAVVNGVFEQGLKQQRGHAGAQQLRAAAAPGVATGLQPSRPLSPLPTDACRRPNSQRTTRRSPSRRRSSPR